MTDRVEPFKLVGQIVGCRRDDSGAIVGEFIAGEITLYEPQFDDLRAQVESGWADVILHHEQQLVQARGIHEDAGNDPSEALGAERQNRSQRRAAARRGRK